MKPIVQARDEDDKAVRYEPPVAGAGPMGPFVNDPTLRKGDIVVTSVGMRVFEGSQGDEHSAKEFVALSKAHLSSSQHVAELMMIEQSNRKYSARFEIADSSAYRRDAAGETGAPKANYVVLQIHRGAKN